MKRVLLPFFASVAVLVSARAQTNVTGEWSFKSGDLRATIGADLQYLGNMSNITTFPSLAVNGQTVRVMAVGTNSVNQGFYMRHGALPNGGGHLVNQYSLVLDVMYSQPAASGWRALFQTDPLNPPGNDAEFYIARTGGIGANGQYDGSLAAGSWYRLAFVVDLTLSTNQLVKYVNGVQVGAQSLPGGIDGQYALGPAAVLFSTGITNQGFTQPGFVNSIAFLNGSLTSNAVAALGIPGPLGIPPGRPSLSMTNGSWQVDTTKVTWNGRPNPSLQFQTTTNLASNWLSFGYLDQDRSLTIAPPITNNLSPFYQFYRLTGDSTFAIDPGAPVEPDVILGTYPKIVTPTKQILNAPGQAVSFKGVGARPIDLVLSPDGQTVYVKNSVSLLVIDVPTWKLLQQTNYPADNASMHGIAVSPDGSHVYVTGAGNELYDWAVGSNRTVSIARTITLPSSSYPCGITLSPDGQTAWVCLNMSNSVVAVDLPSGSITNQITVSAVAPYSIALSSNGVTAYVSDWGGRSPGPSEPFAISAGVPVLVDARGIAASGALSLINITNHSVAATFPVGLHPCRVKLSADEKLLYVANANSDTISVFNTQTQAVQETINVRPNPSLPFGSDTTDLALSPDGLTLYVANGGNNAIAIVELPNASHTNSVVKGFVPTDWYPGAVVADATNLYVANVNGYGSGFGPVEYFYATVDCIPIPTGETLDKYTAQVQEYGRVPQIQHAFSPPQTNRPPVPVPAHVGEPSVFQHVFYVIKENKTYDQLFGDILQGNGDPALCVYPQSNTPNHHALATQYVLLDNFYCNGIQSFDGHSWITEGNNTDYLEKGYPQYSRGDTQGSDPLLYSSSGFIWNNVLEHGLTFTNYGELSASFPSPGSLTWLQVWADYTNGYNSIQYHNDYNLSQLEAYSSTKVSGFNLGIPDQLRAAAFASEFSSVQSNGSWPAFTIIYLPSDHTAGASPGFPTPAAQVADNDLAMGKVVDTISHSVIASNSVIFIIEDDPLGGYDHVDGHRSLCLVVSPYTKRGQTITTFYNHTGLLHTMEQILGIPPMNQMDAMGPLMVDCFTTQPNFTPYTALPNNIPLDTMNPGTTGALKGKDRYWARLSQKLDFSKPDLADQKILSHIIWHSIKGDARYPSAYVGPHGKGLKKLGLYSVKTGKDDDDD